MKKCCSGALIGIVCILFIHIFLPPIKAEPMMLSAADDVSTLMSTDLKEDEAAFLYLGYSGFIIRVRDYTIVTDPANLVIDEDIEILKEHGVDLVLYTHGHGDRWPYRWG